MFPIRAENRAILPVLWRTPGMHWVIRVPTATAMDTKHSASQQTAYAIEDRRSSQKTAPPSIAHKTTEMISAMPRPRASARGSLSSPSTSGSDGRTGIVCPANPRGKAAAPVSIKYMMLAPFAVRAAAMSFWSLRPSGASGRLVHDRLLAPARRQRRLSVLLLQQLQYGLCVRMSLGQRRAALGGLTDLAREQGPGLVLRGTGVW